MQNKSKKDRNYNILEYNIDKTECMFSYYFHAIYIFTICLGICITAYRRVRSGNYSGLKLFTVSQFNLRRSHDRNIISFLPHTLRGKLMHLYSPA
jgi:hypothetical protein